VQPFISGAISKTVNMPEDVTVEDVEQLHIDAWRLGIKAVAIYRDNCKVAQPLSTTKKEPAAVGGDTAPAGSDAEARDRAVTARIAELEAALLSEQQRVSSSVVVGAVRERLPRKRNSETFSFRVADCEGYVTVGQYEDGRPGEVFVKVSKQGSTLAGIMDAFSISISLGLQHGVPLATFVRKFAKLHLPPDGPRLPLGRGALGPRHPLHAGADPADAAGRGGDGDPVGQSGRGRDQQRPGRLGAGSTGAGPGRAARRPPLLQLRQHHAASGLVLRVRELRVDQRVLVVRIRV
jgi:hypothetical protein